MIYTAGELLIALNNLTLEGQADDGELEFFGNAEDWKKVEQELYELN